MGSPLQVVGIFQEMKLIVFHIRHIALFVDKHLQDQFEMLPLLTQILKDWRESFTYIFPTLAYTNFRFHRIVVSPNTNQQIFVVLRPTGLHTQMRLWLQAYDTS